MRRLLQLGLPAVLAGLAVVLSVAGFWLWRSATADSGSLPILTALPQFSLTERNGQSFGSNQLRGHVWIADFFFTSCAGPCPMMSARLAKIQQRYAQQKDLVLVSVTVDPERDTPEVLSRYANHYRASPDRWRFLTGAKEVIYNLARNGMMMAVKETSGAEQAEGDAPVIHSTHFVLVDRDLRVRGYYDVDDDNSIRRLESDVDRLLSRP